MGSPHLAKDLMVTNLITVSPQTHVFDGIQTLLKNKITGAPVVEGDDRYLGVFSEKCCMGVLTLVAKLSAETGNASVRTPLVRDFMVRNLVTIDPHMDVFDAIGHLLKNSISGAPVVDQNRNYLGVFSEKTSMQVLVSAAYDQVPSTEVSAFINTDLKRVISEEQDLLNCAQIFLDTPYRRLPVLRDGKLVGQVSRRDVLANAQIVSSEIQDRDKILLQHSGGLDRSDGPPEATHGRLPSTEVRDFMDVHARTISADVDLLSIAQIFLTTPYRRLPVLRDGKLIGQVSRRDLLRDIHRSLEVVPPRERTLLYLSSLLDRSEAPLE